MLEKLDSIRWDQLGHAYGWATDVPGHLRDLASPNPLVQESAFTALYDSMCVHGGAVEPAALETVPFLIELLQVPHIQNKGLIFDFLYSQSGIAAGWLEEEIPLTEQNGKGNKFDFKDDYLRAETLRNALEAGADVYFSFLNDEDPELRFWAILLPSNLPILREKALALAIERFACEPSTEVKANILDVIARLDLKNNLQLFVNTQEEESDQMLRTVAQYHCVNALGKSSPPKMLDELTQFLLSSDEVITHNWQAELCERFSRLDLANLLGQTSATKARQILPWYLRQTSKPFFFIHDDRESKLLKIALASENEKTDLNNLSEDQKWAIWIVGQRSANGGGKAKAALLEFGLPTEIEELSKLCGVALPEFKPAIFDSEPWWKFW